MQLKGIVGEMELNQDRDNGVNGDDIDSSSSSNGDSHHSSNNNSNGGDNGHFPNLRHHHHHHRHQPSSGEFDIAPVPSLGENIPPLPGLRFKKMEVNGVPIFLLDEKSLRKDIDHCKSCGSFALRQEFYRPHYCVESCYLSSPEWLEAQQQVNAPIKLFKQPALPSEPNPFKKGQMLEAIDPENQSLFCVVSIEEVQGWRLRLHFEGFSNQFDFWVNCDSLDIFPVGWCEEKGFRLQPPGDMMGKPFEWETYLRKKGCDPAPRHCFQIINETEESIAEDIMNRKLEAVDIRATTLTICVATVTKVMGHRFLVHFDSWDNIYDYWADFSSPFIFPIGHCEKHKMQLTPPNEYEGFSWGRYLDETKCEALPEHLFQPLPPVGFKRGMRIECVDQRNPRLIRPAIIHSSEGHFVSIRFEGWPDTYDLKMNELSENLHPVGYCETTGHPLESVPKPSKNICPNLCEGKGNVLDSTSLIHMNKMECPYLMEKERVERVVILIPQGDTTAPPVVMLPSHLPLSRNLTLENISNNTPPTSERDSPLPPEFLKQSMTVDDVSASAPAPRPLPPSPPPPQPKKKPKKQDIMAKMMSLAQTVLKEERPKEYLFEDVLHNLTPTIVRDWDVEQTYDFVRLLPGCDELASVLKEQLVDGDSLLLLSKQDFIGMAEGFHWKKLYYALTVIQAQTENSIE